MRIPTDAAQGREPLSHDRRHPDRLRAFGRMYKYARAQLDALERQGAAPQKIDDAIMLKVNIAEAVGRASCTSVEGASVLLGVDPTVVSPGAIWKAAWESDRAELPRRLFSISRRAPLEP